MTFSLVGRCDRTGAFGAVISSSSPAVAARCAYARAGAGAACTQNVTDPTLGPRLLDELAAGHAAEDALAIAVEAAGANAAYRQLTVVGAAGEGRAFSGWNALGRAETATGPACAAAGNLLADESVPAAMLAAFLADVDADLGDRLLAALAAGRDAGGEESPVRSAGLLIAEQVAWPTTDLRIDWSESDPIADLEALWRLWQPQARDYVARALDPAAAPGFGVAGDP